MPNSGFFLPSPDFLVEQNAVYGGQYEWVGTGRVQAWSLIDFIPATTITFYWTDPLTNDSPTYVGWDLVSSKVLTGVHTRFDHCLFAPVPAEFFVGAGTCPNGTAADKRAPRIQTYGPIWGLE